MNEKYIHYLISTNILKDLKEKNIISDEEFMAIDTLNKESFKVFDNQSFCLIS